MWISGGDHELTENIVHLVLAKIPGGPPGVKGISLFVVPKFLVGRRRLARRAQRRRPGRAQPQDGLPGDDEHAAELRRGRAHPGRAGRRGRLPRRRGAPRPDLHVPHDERGADRRRGGRDRARLHRLPARARLRPHPHAGPARRREGPRLARRCRSSSTPTSAGCCWPPSPTSRAGWRSGLYCARLVDEEQTAESADGPGPGAPAARHAHADRQGLAVAVGAGRPTTWPSRCTAATATPATTRSSSSTGTTGSTRSTRARTASRRSTCSAARSCMQGGAGLALLARRSPRRRRGPRAPSGRGSPPTSTPRVARLGAVTATLWGAGDPDVTLANSHVYLEAAGHVVVAWLWLEQALATGDGHERLLRGQARRRPATSGAGSCRASPPRSTCSSRWTARSWTRPAAWL